MSFPGTLGYDAVDGIVADDVVIPHGDDAYYHERVWRLPRCYFVNDGRRALPPAATRRAAGLPDDALVLACLNQTYKLSPPVFAIWMDVLARVPRAVLWLLAKGSREPSNLRGYAARAGVDPDRLVFAPQRPQEAHIARLRCADLALDTMPVGSHTTGCDALWAGVPMLTCPGQTFASRVGASILHTAGLPELVAPTLDDYRARLAELAAAPETLRDYRALPRPHARWQSAVRHARVRARLGGAAGARLRGHARGAVIPARRQRGGQADARLPSISSIL